MKKWATKLVRTYGLAKRSPFHAHQDASDQHQQGRSNEHYRVNRIRVFGLITVTHDCSLTGARSKRIALVTASGS